MTVMQTKLAAPAHAVQYPGPDPIKLAAVDLRMQPGTVRFQVYSETGWFRKAAVVVRNFRECGQLKRIQHLLTLFDVARIGGRPFTKELTNEAQAADSAEDVAEWKHLTDPCKETARDYAAALKKDIALATEKLNALMEMYEL